MSNGVKSVNSALQQATELSYLETRIIITGMLTRLNTCSDLLPDNQRLSPGLVLVIIRESRQLSLW